MFSQQQFCPAWFILFAPVCVHLFLIIQWVIASLMTNADATLDLICAKRGKISAEAKNIFCSFISWLFSDFKFKKRCEHCIRHDIHKSKRVWSFAWWMTVISGLQHLCLRAKTKHYTTIASCQLTFGCLPSLHQFFLSKQYIYTPIPNVSSLYKLISSSSSAMACRSPQSMFVPSSASLHSAPSSGHWGWDTCPASCEDRHSVRGKLSRALVLLLHKPAHVGFCFVLLLLFFFYKFSKLI